MVHTFIPALKRQGKAVLYEFEASLVYRVSLTTSRATQRKPVLKNKPTTLKKKKQKTKNGVFKQTLKKNCTVCIHLGVPG